MLFNLFTKKTTQPTKVITDDINLEALYIDIKYDLQNNLIITADYDDQTDPSIVAQALYMLNTGQLLSAILESLLKNSDSYTKQLKLQKILTLCNQLMNNMDNESIVKPSDVFARKHEQ